MVLRVIVFALTVAYVVFGVGQEASAQTENGISERQLVEANNAGVLLIRQGKYREAVSQFGGLDFSKATASEQALYSYNFGRALEGNGNFKEAYSKYHFAATKQPEFEAPVDALFRTLQEGKLYDSTPQRIAAAAEIARQLLDRNQIDLATRHLHKSLEIWSRDPQAMELLELLARDYAISSIDPKQFQQIESSFLQSLKAESSLRKAIEELQLAYTSDFRPTFTHGEQIFPAWYRSTAFSGLLKRIGDFYDQEHDPVKALERYSLAVAMDIRNSEACLYAAAVLRDDRAKVDPDGKLFDQLIDTIFMEKGQAYYEVSAEPANWEDILRFHIVLATIFEREGMWGTWEGDPRGAVFQWEHAARAEEKARKYRPNLPPSPGVNLGLAHAYSYIGRRPQALEEYLAAARIFIETSRRREALGALNKAAAVGLKSDGIAQMRKNLGLVFGVVAKSNYNLLFQAAKTGAEDEAAKLSKEKEINIKIDWRAPDEENPQKQTDAVEQLVREGVNGIAASASDPNRMTTAINEAVDSGVPVIMFDSDAPESRRLAVLGIDDAELGHKLMSELAKEMDGKGVLAILAGTQNTPSLQKRVQGVKEESAIYPNIKILDTFFHKQIPEDAAAMVEQVMQAHPEITGWAMVGGWPLFTKKALRWQPGSVKVVAVDALPAELDYVKSGHVQALIARQVYEWGTKSVDMLYAKVAENTNPPSTFVKEDLITVTRENVDQFSKNWEKWLPKK